MVKELEESHDSHGSEEIPRRVRFEALIVQEVVVDEINVEPDEAQDVDPVGDCSKKVPAIGRHSELDDKLEREPGDADVLDVIENSGRSFTVTDRHSDHVVLVARTVVVRAFRVVVVTVMQLTAMGQRGGRHDQLEIVTSTEH